MAQVALSSGQLGAKAVGDLQKELKSEIDFVKNKMEKIDKLIHEVENDTFLKLSQYMQCTDYIKEFNNSTFEIKQRVKECDEQLRTSHVKLQDFLRGRICRIASTTVAAVGKVPAVVGVSIVGVSSVATSARVAVLNSNVEEVRKFREIETIIEFLQGQLKETIDKLKGYISNFRNKNVPVANW